MLGKRNENLGPSQRRNKRLKVPKCQRGLLWPSRLSITPEQRKTCWLTIGNEKKLREVWNNMAADDKKP